MMVVKKRLLKGWMGHEPVECMIELELDADALAEELGEKAFRNKSKRTRAIHGLITCTVRRTTGATAAVR